MSGKGRNDEPGTKTSSPWHRARQAAAQVKPAATQLKALARQAKAAGGAGVTIWAGRALRT